MTKNKELRENKKCSYFNFIENITTLQQLNSFGSRIGLRDYFQEYLCWKKKANVMETR